MECSCCLPSDTAFFFKLKSENVSKVCAVATACGTNVFDKRSCCRFYNLVLLPRLRDDIDEFKKLNFHLYQALCKAMFKPAAFFKGIILPLCEVSFPVSDKLKALLDSMLMIDSQRRAFSVGKLSTQSNRDS